jgi:hypothetical protein
VREVVHKPYRQDKPSIVKGEFSNSNINIWIRFNLIYSFCNRLVALNCSEFVELTLKKANTRLQHIASVFD